MSVYDRETKYMQILSERERKISELAEKLFVSEPTVRRDIAALTRKGLVKCQKGIASLNISSPDQRIPLFLRELEQTEEKQIMASRALKYIKDGQSIMLDASTSAYCIIPLLSQFKNIFVITSGLKAALALSTMNIHFVCCGGEIIHESFSFVGTDAETTLKRYNADVAFFSCRGLSSDGIATDNSILENSIRRIMIENSKEKYLLCDHKKLGKKYLNSLCKKNELNGIISDKELDFGNNP